ncbi:hypothetical protein RI129_002878 [Pyrocoelia pectoralis]|uniref:DNA-directed DNA polymerase n=1 Tax=Pyrocoelia pectoralis TaxID=417401 RepID=A0AAN7VMT0_9COLE
MARLIFHKLIKPVPEGAEPIQWIKDAIAQLVNRGTEGLSPHDMVGFSFCSKDFKNGEGWIRFQPAGEITIGDIWNTISSIYQSNSKGLNTETFCFRVTSVHLPFGSGRVQKFNNFEEECGKVAGNYIFDFKKEFVEYCVYDVEILAQSCLKFRQLMIKEGNVCPFTESVTLPSACNKIFRRNFLKPNTIGLIPKGGYTQCDNQSKIATQWLLLEERKRRINITHSVKQKEARVGGVKVDGFCAETNEVFEFYGCYYHGCPRCFKYVRNTPLTDTTIETLEYRYEATLAKASRIKELGYTVVEMWECDFRRHPTVHIGEECSKLKLETTEGLIKCKILPPHLLFHPVLPVKMNNKLMFVLCRSCGESFNQEPCEHSDDERSLTGTWVIDEVRKAIEKGYKILETYEIWQYKTDQYNKDTKTGGLFNEYINKFVGIKQQSSGWPYYCDTPEKKDNYVKEYFEAEGVRLDPVKIERNPGLRQLGKAVITSFGESWDNVRTKARPV